MSDGVASDGPTQTDVHVDSVKWKVPKKRKKVKVSSGPYVVKDTGPFTDSTGNFHNFMASPSRMISKNAAGYVSPAPNPNQSCGSCSMFKSPTTCSLVRGDIHPEDSCDYWTVADNNQSISSSTISADRLGAGSRPIPLTKQSDLTPAQDQGSQHDKYESTPLHFHQHTHPYHQSAKVWDFGGDTPTTKFGFKYHKITGKYSPVDKGILPPTMKTEQIDVNKAVFHTFQPKVFATGVKKPPNKKEAPISLIDLGKEGNKPHYLVLDGHHRISHARSGLGPSTLPARIDRVHKTELAAIRGLGDIPGDFSKQQLKSAKGTFTSSYTTARTPAYLTWCPQCQEKLENPVQFCPGCKSPTVQSMYDSGAPAPRNPGDGIGGLATLLRKNYPLFLKDDIADLHLPHQNRVGQAAKRKGLGPDAQVAGTLHDVAERTELSPADIARHTTPGAAKLIRTLTKGDGEDYLTSYIPRVIAAGKDAVQLKLSDILDNDQKKWDKFSTKKQQKHLQARKMLNDALKSKSK